MILHAPPVTGKALLNKKMILNCERKALARPFIQMRQPLALYHIMMLAAQDG
jgi:hypothetical protein